MEILVEAGANVNILNKNPGSALHGACFRLIPAVVESLLRQNADIDVVDNYGCLTALHLGSCMALHHGSRTALQLAMSQPANSPNRVAVRQLMATCAQTRLEASSADWIRLARNECNRPQMTLGSMGTARQRRRRKSS